MSYAPFKYKPTINLRNTDLSGAVTDYYSQLAKEWLPNISNKDYLDWRTDWFKTSSDFGIAGRGTGQSPIESVYNSPVYGADGTVNDKVQWNPTREIYELKPEYASQGYQLVYDYNTGLQSIIKHYSDDEILANLLARDVTGGEGTENSASILDPFWLQNLVSDIDGGGKWYTDNINDPNYQRLIDDPNIVKRDSKGNIVSVRGDLAKTVFADYLANASGDIRRASTDPASGLSIGTILSLAGMAFGIPAVSIMGSVANVGQAIDSGNILGALGSLAGVSGIGDIVGDAMGGTTLANVAARGILGGVGSAVTGGDFGKGVLGGLVSYGVGQLGANLLDNPVISFDAAQLAEQGIGSNQIGDILAQDYGIGQLSSNAIGIMANNGLNDPFAQSLILNGAKGVLTGAMRGDIGKGVIENIASTTGNQIMSGIKNIDLTKNSVTAPIDITDSDIGGYKGNLNNDQFVNVNQGQNWFEGGQSPTGIGNDNANVILNPYSHPNIEISAPVQIPSTYQSMDSDELQGLLNGEQYPKTFDQNPLLALTNSNGYTGTNAQGVNNMDDWDTILDAVSSIGGSDWFNYEQEPASGDSEAWMIDPDILDQLAFTNPDAYDYYTFGDPYGNIDTTDYRGIIDNRESSTGTLSELQKILRGAVGGKDNMELVKLILAGLLKQQQVKSTNNMNKEYVRAAQSTGMGVLPNISKTSYGSNTSNTRYGSPNKIVPVVNGVFNPITLGQRRR